MQQRLLILETSQRVGQVALADAATLLAQRTLDESRRHARDLAPAVQALLAAQGWRARELTGVIVSRGPGSYTGLRVGIMSAKTLAYAVRCPLYAINTFDAIYEPLAAAHPHVDVIADAQQDRIYVQRFGPAPRPLTILRFEDWLRQGPAVVTGPGLEAFARRLPASVTVLPAATGLPQPAGLLACARPQLEAAQGDDVHAVEPLYLRASSAEEQWAALGR